MIKPRALKEVFQFLRQVPVILLLLAVFCQGMIAEGFMPDFTPGQGFHITICNGGASTFHKTGTNGHGQPAKAFCPYAAALQSLVFTIVLTQMVFAYLAVSHPAPRKMLALLRLPGNTSPRGPPLFS